MTSCCQQSKAVVVTGTAAVNAGCVADHPPTRPYAVVQIVSERRVADEQKKQVETDSARIAKEEIECQAIATDAQADLEVALPALEKAMAEVSEGTP